MLAIVNVAIQLAHAECYFVTAIEKQKPTFLMIIGSKGGVTGVKYLFEISLTLLEFRWKMADGMDVSVALIVSARAMR